MAAFVILELGAMAYFGLLPTQDGPSHVANTRLLVQLLAGDPAATSLYDLNLFPFPNWTTSVIMLAAGATLGWGMAEAAVHILGFGLWLAGCWLTLGRSGVARIWPLALMAPLFFNILFFMGFYNLSLSMSLFLIMAGLWWRTQENGTRIGDILLLAMLGLCCYFTHFIGFMAAGTMLMMSLAMETMSGKHVSPARAWTPLLAFAPGGALLVLFFGAMDDGKLVATANAVELAWQAAGIVALATAAYAALLRLAPGPLRRFGEWVAGIKPRVWIALVAVLVLTWVGGILYLDHKIRLAALGSFFYLWAYRGLEIVGCLLLALAVAGPLVLRLRAVVREGYPCMTPQGYALLVFLLGGTTVLLLLPQSMVKGMHLLDHRMAPFVYSALVLWLVRREYPPLVEKAACVSACLGLALLAAGHLKAYSAYDAMAREYVSVAEALPQGANIVPINLPLSGTGHALSDSTVHPEAHIDKLLLIRSDLRIHTNYEAGMGYFPLRWRPELAEESTELTSAVFLGDADYVLTYLEHHAVPYVVVFGIPGAEDNERFHKLVSAIRARYDLVHTTSPTGLARVYARPADTLIPNTLERSGP